MIPLELLLLDPDVVETEWRKTRRLIEEFLEAVKSALEPLLELLNELASTGVLAEIVKLERRAHAHYARHAGAPRSRTRRGRRR